MARPRCPTCDSTTRGLYSRHGETATFLHRAVWECVSCSRVTPANLDELRELLLTGHVDERLWADLPTFGGAALEDTTDVWSWDAEHLLVGSGRDLKIVSRKTWNQ